MALMPTLTPLALASLRAAVHGRVVAPGDAEYDAARAVITGGIDRHPAVIVRAANAADVTRVITLARETGLELAVRSGGHSGAGHGTTEGGIVLDLSAMKSVEVDLDRRTVWAETGLTAGELTVALHADGVAVGLGDTASVGIGGITTGGGIGYLVRKHGLTIDSLLAVDMVTAAGELVRADAASHPDLFWAIRGGGGNFGVVTRFEFRLHEVGTVVGGDADPARHGRDARRVHRGGRGRPRRALDDRERDAGTADAVPGSRAPREARRAWRSWSTSATWRRASGRSRRSARSPSRSPTWCGRWPTRRCTRPMTRSTARLSR